MLNKRLAIGTAQFGLEYGVANQGGQVSLENARTILEYAHAHGLDSLDTAILYGNSQERLGEIGVSAWKVYSKLPDVPDHCNDIDAWIQHMVDESLRLLHIPKLNTLLLHRPNILLSKHGNKIFKALNKLVDKGLIKKIGISIYDPEELNSIVKRFPIDVVQAPFNPIDNRLITSGWLERFKEKNIELHVRSIFLQGLLLMKPDDRPERFNRWTTLWSRWRQWLMDNKLTPLQVCLRHSLSYSQIERVIIGINSLPQLEEILLNVDDTYIEIPTELQCDDLNLINPSRWVKC